MDNAVATITQVRGVDWTGQKRVTLRGRLPSSRTVGELAEEIRLQLGLEPGSYGVYLPDLPTRLQAEDATRRVLEAGFGAPSVREVGHDVSSPSGPWVVNVLRVDPTRFRLEVVHSVDAAIGVETTRATARRTARTSRNFPIIRRARASDRRGPVYRPADHPILRP